MSKAMSVFSENLYKIRKLRGYTQPQLAELCDLSLNTIAYYEQRRQWPTRESLAKLSKVLKVDEMEFFAKSDSKNDSGHIPLLSKQQLKQIVSPELAVEILSEASSEARDKIKKFIPPDLALEVLKKALRIKEKPRLT